MENKFMRVEEVAEVLPRRDAVDRIPLRRELVKVDRMVGELLRPVPGPCW